LGYVHQYLLNLIFQKIAEGTGLLIPLFFSNESE
jgi:hypothetical protein